ncbi:MAG: serine hydrolase domain-containing protein [Gemmatimonadota bacterium]
MFPRFGWLARVVCVAILAAGRPASAAQETVVSGDLGERVDEFMKQRAESGFSGSVLVARGGELALLKGYGLADTEDSIPNRGNTLFDLGSIAKDFTLAAVLKLEEQGRLDPSDRLYRFFPASFTKADITIDQVMRMEAGFQEYHDEFGDFEEMTRREALGRIFEQEPLFEPGTDQAYSNSGFTLLAAMVEVATGEPFQDFVRAEFFAPAGMTTAGFYGESLVPEDRVAVGRDGAATHGERNSPPYWGEVTWALQGSGGMVGSLLDLFRWQQALAECTVLSCAFVEKYAFYNPAQDGIRYQAGGNDFGFVFVTIELVAEDGFIAFAQNNNPLGEEDPDLVRGLIECFRAE